MPVLTNVRHELFAQAVAKGADLIEAYADAGFKRHDSCASRLRSDAKVAARIDEILKDAALATGVTVERVTQEIASIAFFNIADVVEWGTEKPLSSTRKGRGGQKPDGAGDRTFVKLKNSCDLSERDQRAIAMIKKTRYGVEVKPHDKLAALIRLGMQLGMFRPEDKDKTGVDALVDMIVEAHRRSQGDDTRVIERGTVE
jgi:phage terminase small subunit